MKDCKILIVDDDPVVQFLHEQMILRSDLDSEVLKFTHGEEALNYINKATGSLSILVLLDIHMPVMNGWELLDELTAKAFNFPIEVAIVSSSHTDADRKKASQYKLVSAFLTKPIKNVDEIRNLIHLQKKEGY